jgi:ubiquinone/menaquinone biosynthesis C-methylase UbiE
LARAAGVEVELLCSNVYEIPGSFDAAFDLVYVTIGALGWLPDARAFLDVVTRLLEPGGQLFLYEMHPVLNVFDEQHLTPAAPLVARSYFAREPTYGEALPDYFDKTQLVQSPSYWFHHSLGTILGGLLAAGLTLSHFQEYPHDLSGVYAALEGSPHSLPMSFSLIAKK